MDKNKTSAFSNGLIWFGAAVSIAEILTGTYFAPLGFGKGLFAIVIGHLIGGILFYFTGLIGAKTEKSAMETAKISFGQKGSVLFSGLNILQLVGWTAVMIITGAEGANSIISLGIPLWSIIIGALIILWVSIGIKRMNQINIAALGALFILTIILSSIVFRNNGIAIISDSLSFGTAVELSVAMPLSWLPLISDYTRTARKPRLSTFVSAATYFFASCWMYTIGMGAAIFTGESDIAKIMINAGLGVAALIIVVFATVTTTFLDAYSAGVSSESISIKFKEKPVAIAVCVIGVILAIFTPITQYENFLYLIGSVFAPMAAILITDYFVIKRDYSGNNFCWTNLILWAAGFTVYRISMSWDTPLGYTVPSMIITSLLRIIIFKLIGDRKNA